LARAVVERLAMSAVPGQRVVVIAASLASVRRGGRIGSIGRRGVVRREVAWQRNSGKDQ
jgi:hypothetical protein